jgi:hypothetical protein
MEVNRANVKKQSVQKNDKKSNIQGPSKSALTGQNKKENGGQLALPAVCPPFLLLASKDQPW